MRYIDGGEPREMRYDGNNKRSKEMDEREYTRKSNKRWDACKQEIGGEKKREREARTVLSMTRPTLSF